VVNVGQKAKLNKDNTMIEYTNECNNTNNNINTGRSPREIIIIIRRAMQSGVEKCDSTEKQIPKPNKCKGI
jgi:hypothetical protein